MTRHTVHIGDDDVAEVVVGFDRPLALIAGPCVIESGESCMAQAKAVAAIARDVGIPFVFKASFDKANRTSADSPRGVGIEEGLAVLSAIRAELGVPVLTDVHSPDQAGRVGEIVDCLQIPAFLCRQTDLLTAAGASGACVNIKKGQFLAPGLMRHAAAKVVAGAEAAGKKCGVLLTERGSSFGYGDLVVDMRSLSIMRDTGWPVVFDATHSVQKPGGHGNASGGDRSMIAVLTRAAVAAGIDVLFVETHPEPSRACSDADSQLPHSQLGRLLEEALAVRRGVDGIAV
jgi:2-dehydro-3-deoxyphosphooctonate aldolase (KDO 8-P synthase)